MDLLKLPLDTWFDGSHVEPWLDKLVRMNAESPSLADRLTAVGSVIHLWSPSPGKAFKPETPPHQATEFLRHVKMDHSVASMVMANAMNRVYALMEDIDHLVDVNAPEGMRMACYARDDLASLQVAMYLCGVDIKPLSAILDAADGQVEELLPKLPAAPEDDDRLWEVASTWPSVWWIPQSARCPSTSAVSR